MRTRRPTAWEQLDAVRKAASLVTDPGERLLTRVSSYFLAMESRGLLSPEAAAHVRAEAPRLAALIREAGGAVKGDALVYSVAPDGTLVCSLPLGET